MVEAAESAGYVVEGVLDLLQNVGDKVLGHTIIGTDDDIAQYVHSHEFVVTVGHIKESTLRRKIAEKISRAGGVLATVVASTARVSPYAQIGAGTVVLHGAVVNAAAVVGAHCIVNTLANVEHDAVVGDFCHISTGAMVNGACTVGADTFLGSQSVLLNGAEVPEGCVVAAGSFVRKSIKERGIYAGNPAVLMKKI